MKNIIEEISVKKIIFDDDPDISWLQQYDENSEDPEIRKYAKQDKKRLEAYYNEEWHFIGVQAVAEVRLGGVCQTIKSGGLWGIESDSSEDYIESIYKEEKEDLSDMLQSIGFSTKEIEGEWKQ